MVFHGSRYSRTEVIAPLNAKGKSTRVLAMRAIPRTPGVLEYTVVEGERLDHLAQRFYADPKKYWLILDANLDELYPMVLLQPGHMIKVPQNRIVS